MSNPKVKRPKYLLLMAMVLLLAGLFQACSAPAAPAPAADSGAAVAESSGPVVNALGKELPADAAPLDQQVLVYAYAAGNTFTTLDFFEAVYQRADSLTDLLSDALVRVDIISNCIPALPQIGQSMKVVLCGPSISTQI